VCEKSSEELANSTTLRADDAENVQIDRTDRARRIERSTVVKRSATTSLPPPRGGSNFNVRVSSISNPMYDENWANKQMAGFTEWMNFTFSSYQNGRGELTDDNAPNGMSEDPLALKSLMQKVRRSDNESHGLLFYIYVYLFYYEKPISF
jgi:hypothetical protein